MNTLIKHGGWLSLLLTLPALLLCTAGVLQAGFGLEALNDSLETFLRERPGKLLFSPVVVFGGLVMVIALNALSTCRLTADVYDNQFTVAASLKLVRRHLIPLGVALLLLLLLLTYVLVENFRLVTR